MAKIVYLGLGSNMGDRRGMLRKAIEKLEARDLRIQRVSAIYETAPMELADQRWFLNLVAEAETDLFPMQLLGRVQRVEHQLGRRRVMTKGPRTIDIDILFYGGSVIDSPRLVVPHPSVHERRFVLEPLSELAPELRHPVLRRSVIEMLGEVRGQALRKFEEVAHDHG